MILYHGTSANKAKQIMKHGFNYAAKPTWKVVSKSGFVYLSLAYAPFYAMAKNKSNKGALIKVYVNDSKLYPDDDFLMLAVKNKSVYNQDDLDSVDIVWFKHLYSQSLKYLGNACAKIEDVEILGVRYFDLTGFMIVCDPTITPINYKIMGSYYEGLTKAIYDTGEYQKYVKYYYKNLYGGTYG